MKGWAQAHLIRVQKSLKMNSDGVPCTSIRSALLDQISFHKPTWTRKEPSGNLVFRPQFCGCPVLERASRTKYFWWPHTKKYDIAEVDSFFMFRQDLDSLSITNDGRTWQGSDCKPLPTAMKEWAHEIWVWMFSALAGYHRNHAPAGGKETYQ